MFLDAVYLLMYFVMDSFEKRDIFSLLIQFFAMRKLYTNSQKFSLQPFLAIKIFTNVDD